MHFFSIEVGGHFPLSDDSLLSRIRYAVKKKGTKPLVDASHGNSVTDGQIYEWSEGKDVDYKDKY